MKTKSILCCIVFAIAANLFITPAKAQVDVNDSLALVDLYNSTNGPKWSWNTNWLTTNPVSTWYGITVEGTRVTYIYLGGNHLSGTIPSSIGNLVKLSECHLDVNRLTGTIPSSIGNLLNLTWLNLSFNQLSGAIPSSIGNLVKLELLSLRYNRLSGSIPFSIGNLVKLEQLGLDNNQLSGAIPSSIGNLVKLPELDLSINQLSGSIPSSVGNLVKLEKLILYDNKLSGTIPSSIGNLVKLIYLWLSNNQLSGTIPSSIGNLVNLRILYLFNNQLNSIPASIGKLVNLEDLYLENNQLSGSIPSAIGNLASLEFLSLSNNQLTGNIPTSFRKLHNLLQIDLSNNQMSQSSNINFSGKSYSFKNGNIQYNLFTFDGMEYVAQTFVNVNYAPQAIIPLHQNGNTLSVYAGGTLSNNTYNWHRAGTTDSTIIKADSTFTPTQSSKYYVTVNNRIATKLTLHSDTIDFTLSPVKQNSSSTLITKATQPTTIIQHMQVYPNPIKDVVHVQVKGTATIVVADANGKVMLTKSINNTNAINVSSLAPGIYYLQNKTSGEVQKIIVVH
jgi:Leucine-rich repeat (LRR) protein